MLLRWCATAKPLDGIDPLLLKKLTMACRRHRRHGVYRQQSLGIVDRSGGGTGRMGVLLGVLVLLLMLVVILVVVVMPARVSVHFCVEPSVELTTMRDVNQNRTR